tara:strand:- start:1780 stop:3933 length:2154 start_codon:yes stop_codon:yes gene_type:complete
MGAYENPAIIRDNSGQVYGQAIANFGKSIGDGFKIAAANRQNLAKQAKKEAERIQGVQFRIEQNQYQEKNRNYETLRDTGVPLLEQFDDQTGIYMMGRGKPGDKDYLMGAIEAQTLLATSSGLSVEDRQGLNAIVERNRAYQKNMIANAGKVISELELYKSIPASEWEQNFSFQGANLYEKQSTQFAAAILSNQKIPGAIRTTKNLEPVSADGTNVLTTRVVMDPNNVNLGGKFSDEKEYPRDKDGNIEFVWSKDLNGDINLINEIDAAPESAKIAQEMGIIDEKGNISKGMFVGGTGVYADDSAIRGLPNYTSIKTEKIVNVGSWEKLVSNDLRSKAAGILKSYETDHLQAFMSQRMRLSNNFDLNKFRGTDLSGEKDIMNDFVEKMIKFKMYPEDTKWTGTASQQEDFLKNELFENFLEQRTTDLKQRPAQSFDKKPGGGFQDWVVMDPTTGEPTVYFQGTEQVTKKGGGETGYNPKPLVNKFVKQFTDNPDSMAREILKDNTVKSNIKSEGFKDGAIDIAAGTQVTTLGKKGEDKYMEFDLSIPEHERRFARTIIKEDERISTLPTKDRQMVVDGIVDSFPNTIEELSTPKEAEIAAEVETEVENFNNSLTTTLNSSGNPVEIKSLPSRVNRRSGDVNFLNNLVENLKNKKDGISTLKFIMAMNSQIKKDTPKVSPLFGQAITTIFNEKEFSEKFPPNEVEDILKAIANDRLGF